MRKSLLTLYKFTILGLIAFLVGCASVAPLDDAKVENLTLASSADIERYQKALAIWARGMFGGATFSDGKGHITASFKADQYDEYLEYESEHPVPAMPRSTTPKWPILHLTFESNQLLLDSNSSNDLKVAFWLCKDQGDSSRLYGFGVDPVMWHGQFVTPKIGGQINAELSGSKTPQMYEVFFEYINWSKEDFQRDRFITLLPLPEDLCMATYAYNFPMSPSIGRPLRISKELINQTMGDLSKPLLEMESEPPLSRTLPDAFKE
jgi:hypothetical protein